MSQDTEESTEHFFTSFTDLLVGVIFLFILLLMVFALNMKQSETSKPVIITEQIRANILREIERRMKERGTPVTLDFTNGVVRLPESLLFDSGQWTLLPEGQKAVESLAIVMQEILPCASESTSPCKWEKQPVMLDTVLVEGHTDNRPFNSPQGFTNWELSAFRSIAVYKKMMEAAPELEQAIMNPNHQPLVGVSAYADRRPVVTYVLDPNRRIDVRFTMRANNMEQSQP
jgi:chemotaxis protein MotB